MTLAIITVFIIGYLCIAFESGLKINKSAIALFMCVICWTLYMFGCETYIPQFHSHDFWYLPSTMPLISAPTPPAKSCCLTWATRLKSYSS